MLQNGQCVSCDEVDGWTKCNGICIKTANDVNNCGACGRKYITECNTTTAAIIGDDGYIYDFGDYVHSVPYSVRPASGIVDFADTVDIEKIRAIFDRQIACNMAIAEEGLRGHYGANIGKVLLATYGDSIMIRARAKAAAASDARMNGC